MIVKVGRRLYKRALIRSRLYLVIVNFEAAGTSEHGTRKITCIPYSDVDGFQAYCTVDVGESTNIRRWKPDVRTSQILDATGWTSDVRGLTTVHFSPTSDTRLSTSDVGRQTTDSGRRNWNVGRWALDIGSWTFTLDVRRRTSNIQLPKSDSESKKLSFARSVVMLVRSFHFDPFRSIKFKSYYLELYVTCLSRRGSFQH